ncbi:hypothetical protein Tamer19_52290 [Cupriavidus sp. TA19]|uniref:DUF2933 domain-containing protein n=1 Tax=unclassified Cupriavidus TaxID=2640874 RepID=UPI000E2E8F92|nr:MULTISPECIES: DUF2933 domain-containing protein [unclassified Cupriavidus]BDB29314.1 DUF2933 domain-containing protein [Cupriavidus sp. P-10]GLC95820.1 hypothetical protein Tamer19_52290 [Cupriavidus sp. TA19]
MNHDHLNHERPEDARRSVSRSKLVMIGFLLVIGYFLWTEHQAHVIQFLPFVLLAACPLMHMFMHSAHGHGHGRERDEGTKDVNTKGER